MAERKYTLQDVYDYLKECYNFDWRLGKVLADQEKDGTFKFKFGGNNETHLTALVDAFIDERKEKIWIEVNNQDFIVKKLNPRLKKLDSAEISWQDFLENRYHKSLGRTI